MGTERSPFFSVIIPAYNKGILLKATLKSALLQKYADYEIIIIDDGSTDNTKEIVQGFTDSRIKYFYQKNSGLPANARNRGIHESRGKYIAFLDADDIWDPEKLMECYKILEQNPDLHIICHDEIIRDITGRYLGRNVYGPYTSDMFRNLLFKGNSLSTSATVVSKQALTEVGNFREFPEFFATEDYDLWMRLGKNYQIFFLNKVLGEYLQHENNISINLKRMLKNELAVLYKNFKEIDQKKISDTILITIRIIKVYGSFLLMLFKKYFIPDTTKQNNLKVSVVIPAYNCAKWIKRTINDVLNQSYPVHEILVVDDGSKDNTGEKVDSFCMDKVKYIRLPSGSGSPAKPRNVGLNAVTGEYVSFLDHDDRWYPDRMEKVMKVFEKNKNVSVVCHDELVVAEGIAVERKRYGPYKKDMYVNMLLKGNYVSTSATTLKVSVVKNMGGFVEGKDHFLVEDFDLWLRLAKAGYRYHFIHEVLGEYTIHSDNWTKNMDYNYSQESMYYNSEIRKYPEVLERYKGKILGRLEFSYGRNFHKNGEFFEAEKKYNLAIKNGFKSLELVFAYFLLKLRIKI